MIKIFCNRKALEIASASPRNMNTVGEIKSFFFVKCTVFCVLLELLLLEVVMIECYQTCNHDDDFCCFWSFAETEWNGRSECCPWLRVVCFSLSVPEGFSFFACTSLKQTRWTPLSTISAFTNDPLFGHSLSRHVFIISPNLFLTVTTWKHEGIFSTVHFKHTQNERLLFMHARLILRAVNLSPTWDDLDK